MIGDRERIGTEGAPQAALPNLWAQSCFAGTLEKRLGPCGQAALTRLAGWQVKVVDPGPAKGLAPADCQPHAAGGGTALGTAHVPPCAAARQ